MAAGVRVDWTRRIYTDDQWSGWPDIVRWRGRYYVCFANGSAHGSRDHSILLITSENLEVWSPRDFAQVCFADPPYTEWRFVKTDTVLEGAAVAEIGERIVAMGRCSEFEGQESITRWYDASRRTGIFFYENGVFKRQALLPSGGDTGYPGVLPLEDNRALVIWYSEHERMQDADCQYKRCASIYLAAIAITE